MADDSDKTEEPTQRKLDEAREKGQLGKSNDLTAALVTLAAITFLFVFGIHLVDFHFQAAQLLFGEFHTIELNESSLNAQAATAFYATMAAVLPFLLVLFVTAILANVLQFGFVWTLKPLAPDFDKINPIKGLQNKFNLKSLVMTAMNLAKTALFTYIAYKVIQSEWDNIFRLTGQELLHSLALFVRVFFKLSFYIVLAMLVLAIIDFAYHKWQNNANLRMSKQELKDEYKNYEGDPKIKQKRRQIQLQMSRRRMMKDVKDADVVITNPTHYAVAIKYDEGRMVAPVLVAKGVDLLALRIKDIAKDNGVPIVENKPLARSLYNTVEVGEPIPQKLFKAVAEILAYVYNLKKGGKKGRKVG